MAKFIPREMGLQIPCRNNTEISDEKVIWAISQTCWISDPRFVPPKKDRDVGRTLNAGPYPYVFEHSPKIQCCVCHRIFERQKRSPDTPGVIEDKARDRSALLVAQVLRKHGWFVRGDHKKVHP